ncbi:zinc finger protein 574 isoform X2 [Gadus macrocephalus]|uniref:zinc finger protein 574 isoform X2 n=1 Tax=Gadus macrocephalus TaxID=80720 RepID=UPI0028CBAFCA|nr:zinc finger protein 574 isoform X2 [Gadus macrocephalus]
MRDILNTSYAAMTEPGEDVEGVYVEHQYMCSECQELFNTLEDVLVHQQIHNGVEGDGEQEVSIQDMTEMEETQQYQCLECGALLVNSDELLQHQEMHMREAGMEVEHQELCEVLETDEAGAEDSGPVKYQCLDCLALFDSPDVWLEHRNSHSRSSTHSKMEYVLQSDGTITLLNSVQNYVLSDQQAEEILAQVLTQQQQQQLQQQQLQQLQQQQQQRQPKKRQIMSKPPNAAMLSAVSPSLGSATMHLQILTAQALADGSTTGNTLRTKTLPPLLSTLGPGSSGKVGLLDNGLQRLEIRLAPGIQGDAQQQAEMVVIHPYECSECSLLFQTPEDFLQHQGEHFLGQDKESSEAGVMSGFEELRAREDAERTDESRLRLAEKRNAIWATPQQCELCNRTFTSANRLAAHKRVHEQGTHECPECDKVFKKATSLQTHMRTHSGVARYLCVDCGHGFTTEMTLIMHRKSHIADPLHKCQVCSKTFTNMTKFLYHRRTHLNRDPSAQPTPIASESAPRRASLSALTILQRARERREAARMLEEPNENNDLLAPLTDDQMQQMEEEGGQGEGGEEVKRAGGGLLALSSDSSSLLQQAATEVGLVDHPAPNGDSVCASSESQDPAAAPAPPASAPDKGAFSCRSCPKTFSSPLQLANHRRKFHVPERSFVCGVCSKSFKKQIHMRNHLRTHTGERPFQCSDCGKTFSSLANLMRHSLIHSGVRPYRCDVCERTFSQSSNLRQHSLLHDAPAKLTCPDCPSVFAGPSKLAAHRYTAAHPGAPAPFPCPHCESGFLTRRQRDFHCLEQHASLLEAGAPLGTGDPAVADAGSGASSAHTTEEGEAGGSSALVRGGLDCKVCGKKLNSFPNLRLHQLSHQAAGPGRSRAGTGGGGGGGGTAGGKRPKAHQCPICGKLFVSSSAVALHQRVHTGERPFPCQVCGKRFRQNTHLREHLRTHSGERPFRCEVCGKGFIQSMHLAEHRRTHTGERPHACPQCGKAFKTFSNLRNHKKTHARQQKLQEEAAQVPMETSSAVSLVDGGAGELFNGQPQIIQIQASDLQQAQGTPTIMCNEFGETIAIIETAEGGTLALEQALEIYHTALENGLTMDTVTVEGLQLL